LILAVALPQISAMIGRSSEKLVRWGLSLTLATMLFGASAAIAAGDSVRPFVAGSLAKIVAEHQGAPFILSLWSVTCTHCPQELRALAKLKAAHPKLQVVLVAADSPEDAPQAAELARSYGLAKAPQWIFADDMPERLRFEIDRNWHGELPRTYFYGRKQQVEAVSGLVPEARLAQWVRDNLGK
jgi:hypothetical protein